MSAPEENPVLGVFFLKPSVTVPKSLSFLTPEELAALNFQEFTRQELISALQNRDDDPTYASVLRSLGFSFVFRPDLVPFIADSEDKDLMARFFLYNYAAWLLKPVMDHMPIVIESLFQLLGSPFEVHALRAVEHCFCVYFSKDPLGDFEVAFPIFVKFFRVHKEYAMKDQFQGILPRYLRVLQAGSQETISSGCEPMRKYLVFLRDFAQENASLFKKEVASEIMYALTSEITRLDDVALQLFGELSDIADEVTVTSLAMLLPMPLRQAVEGALPCVGVKDETGQFCCLRSSIEGRQPIASFPEFSMNIQAQFMFVSVDTFENGLDVRTGLKCGDKPSLSSLLPVNLLRKVKLIAQALRNNRLAQETIFKWAIGTLAEMQKNDSVYYLEMMVVMTLFYRRWRKSIQSSQGQNADQGVKMAREFWATFQNSLIFDERLNFVACNSRFKIVDQLRSLIFDSLAIDGFSQLLCVLKFFVTKISLMAEVFHRIMSVFDRISKDILLKNGVLKVVSAVAVYFQSVHFHCNPEDHTVRDLIELTRSSIFLFVNHIVQDDVLVMKWFSDQVFVTSLFGFLFEKSIRPFILQMIKSYMVNATTMSLVIVSELNNLTNIAFSRMPDLAYTDLLCDVLQTLNECFAHGKPDHVALFQDLPRAVCTSLKRLARDEQGIAERYLVEAVQFFAVTHSCSPLGLLEMDVIKHAVNLVEQDEPVPALFSKFIQLIAGSLLSSISPVFVIANPKALCTLVRIYLRSTKLCDVLNFVKQLVNYSFTNSIKVSNAGFDVDLLDIVREHRFDDFLSERAVQMIFEIIGHVSCVVGSAQVVQRFITLFAPENGRLSKYHNFFIKNLTDIISDTINAPEAWLPLEAPRTHVKVNGITTKDLTNEFTIVFWVFVDNPCSQERVEVFALLDTEQIGLRAVISSGNMLMIVSHECLDSVGRCEIPLPYRKWTPVMFRIRFVNEKTLITPVIDHYKCMRLEYKWTGFKEGPLDLFLGVGANDEIDDIPVMLACFALYTEAIPFDDFSVLCEAGTRWKRDMQHNPKFFVSAIDRDGYVGVEAHGAITAEMVGPKISCAPSFCDVLLSMNKFSLLLPLFSMLDLPSGDVQADYERVELLVDLLSLSLQIHVALREEIEDVTDMEVIGYLLCASKACHFRYSTYARFYSLFQSIQNSALQESLMEHVLTNFSLLMRSDKQTQIRILRHWNRVLMPAYQSMFSKFVTMWALVGLMIEKCDVDAFPDIRRAVLPLIKSLAHEQLDLLDLKCLLSYTIQADNDSANEMIETLTAVVASDEGTLESIDKLERMTILEILMAREDPLLFQSVLGLFTELHQRKYLHDFPCYLHSEVLILQMSSGLVTSEILIFLKQQVNTKNVFGLIPLCCFIALNLGDMEIEGFFADLKPHKLDIASRFWVVAVASLSAYDIRRKILNYLLECHENDWHEIAVTIEIVTSGDCDNYSKMMHEFLLLLSEELKKLDQDDLTAYETYFELASLTICFQQTSNAKEIDHLFRASPFAHFHDVHPKITSSRKANLPYRMKSRSLSRNLDVVIQSADIPSDSSEPDIVKSCSFGNGEMVELGSLAKERLSLSDMFIIENNDLDEERRLQYDVFWLERIVKNYRKTDRVFKIRTDKNGDWLDKDIALITIQLFEKWKNPLFIEFDLLLCAYLVKYNPRAVEQHLNSVQFTRVRAHSNSFQLILKNIRRFGNTINPPYMPKSFDPRSADECLRCMAKRQNLIFESRVENAHLNYKKLIKRTRDQMARLSDFRSLDDMSLALDQQQTLVASEKEKFAREKEIWAKHWSKLTSELGPWESAVTPTSISVQYRRDRTLCSFLCPWKMKRKVARDKPNSLSPLPEKKIFQTVFECVLISGSSERPCSLEIAKDSVIMTFEKSRKVIPGSSIQWIFPRRRFHVPSAAEIILWDGRSFLLNSTNGKGSQMLREIYQIATCLRHQPIIDPILYLKKRGKNTTKEWVTGKLSNFHYLLILNYFGGRSFSDITSYPIFPWIMSRSSFECESLDLEDPTVFRDFTEVRETLEKAPVTARDVQTFLGMSPSGIETFNSVNTRSQWQELIPEFFYFPEFLSGDNPIELPKWAKSPVDFVYQHRKALESASITKTLNLWIDLVFGCRQAGSYPPYMYEDCDPHFPNLESLVLENGQLPLKLFRKPHPPRVVTDPEPLLREPVTINIPRDARASVYAFVETSSEPLSLSYLVFCRSGTVKRISVKEIHTQDIQSTTLLSLDESMFPQSDGTNIVVLNGGKFAATISGTNSFVQLINLEEGKTLAPMKFLVCNVTSLAGDGNYLVLVGGDMVTRVYNINSLESPIYELASYRGATTCAAASVCFGVLVTGTSDGSLMICSLRKGRVERVVNLDKRTPRRIEISPGWGFILVFTEKVVNQELMYELLLYTINGIFISSVCLESELCACETYTCNAGFDWAILALTSGKIFNFELYYMNPGKKLDQYQSVVSVHYVRHLGAALVVSKTGRSYILPVLC